MALQFPTPSELRDQYLQNLKNLKPEVDIKKTDSDWYIRGSVNGGIQSGVYADQRKIADDAFPQNARREALQKHLRTYFDGDFIQATPAIGDLAVTGVNATVIPIGTQFVYTPSGNVYQSTDDVTLAGVTGLVPVQSILTGQSQNLLGGAELTCSAPPAGLNATAESFGVIGGGRDVESNDEASARILDFIRQPPAGGTAADYRRFAMNSDPSVTDASIIRFINGLGTVGIIITAGTTDIDAALNNGIPVVREPSQDLVDLVQASVDAQKVITDCITVAGPNPVSMDVTVKVRFGSGGLATIEPNSGLTYEALVQREVKRAIFKTPPGGRLLAGSGFVVASEIEEVIDQGLSALPYTVGQYAQILVDRQVQDLSATGPNLFLNPVDIAEPNVINVVLM